MSKTFATHVFNVHSTEKDAVTLRDYTSDANTLSYKRTPPKRVKDFPGMAKTEMKHTLTDATGGIIGIVSISTSIRADASLANVTQLKDVAVAAQADATWTDLIVDQRLPLAV